MSEDVFSFQLYFWTGCWPEDEPFQMDTWRTVYISSYDVTAVIERYHFYTRQVHGPVDKINPEEFEHHKIAEIRLYNKESFLVWDKDRTAKNLLLRKNSDDVEEVRRKFEEAERKVKELAK